MPKRRETRHRLTVEVPHAFLLRLRFVPVLDGRPAIEWVRATIGEALSRLLLERPGWAWSRPGAPWWREGGSAGAPAGALAGGERVMVLALLPECFDEAADDEGDGLGLLVDVVPADEGPASRLLRRVVLRAVDVLPWRRRAGEPIPLGSPGAEHVREQVAGRILRERARKARSSPVDPGGPLV